MAGKKDSEKIKRRFLPASFLYPVFVILHDKVVTDGFVFVNVTNRISEHTCNRKNLNLGAFLFLRDGIRENDFR